MRWLGVVLLLIWCGSAHAQTLPCIGGSAPPAAIAALGLTCHVFHDGPFSLGTIDLANTATLASPNGSCASGKCNWYTDSNTPNAAIGVQCPGAAGTCVPTPSSTISISGGVLTLNRLTAYSGSRVDLTTCKYNGVTDPPGTFGSAFPTPAYVRFTAAFTYGQDSATAEAAIWTVSQNYNHGGVRALQAIELDFLEGVNGPGGERHTNTVKTNGLGGQTEIFQQTIFGSSHVHGTLIMPQSTNPNSDGSVTGLVQDYDNDVLIPSNKLTFGTGVVPKYNGTQVIGTSIGDYDTLNTDQYCLWMGSGQAIPLNVTDIDVWTFPPPAGGRTGMFR